MISVGLNWLRFVSSSGAHYNQYSVAQILSSENYKTFRNCMDVFNIQRDVSHSPLVC
jgi:hypothetical protein